MPSQPRHQSDQSLKGFSLGVAASGPVRHSTARRAIQEVEKGKRGWLRNGLAALAIAGLGLGVTGAVSVTGSAHEPGTAAAQGITMSQSAGGPTADGTVSTSRAPQPTAPTDAQSGHQSGHQTHQKPAAPLDGTVNLAARRAAQASVKVTDTTQQDSGAQAAAAARAKALKASFDQTEKLSSKLSKSAPVNQIAGAAAPIRTPTIGSASKNVESAAAGQTRISAGDGQAHLPVNPGKFTIAATFGQVGAWARYHTGVDFAAPIGTPIHATANGVITNAGIGPASSWAGNYVVIKFSDGEQMLFAHMSSVAVSTRQQVSGGQLIGHVGMTGRAFGPHTHVELYPAGMTPGDVYSAVDPAKWFTAHGLHI